MQVGFERKRIKTNRKKKIVKCLRNGCNWRLRASIGVEKKSLGIKDGLLILMV